MKCSVTTIHYQTVSWKSVFLTFLIIPPMSRYKITQPSILVFFTLSIFHPMPKYKDTNPSNLGSLCRPVYAQGLTKHCVDLACNLFYHEQSSIRPVPPFLIFSSVVGSKSRFSINTSFLDLANAFIKDSLFKWLMLDSVLGFMPRCLLEIGNFNVGILLGSM